MKTIEPGHLPEYLKRTFEALRPTAVEMPVTQKVWEKYLRSDKLDRVLVVRVFHGKPDTCVGTFYLRTWMGNKTEDDVIIDLSHSFSRSARDEKLAKPLKNIPGIVIFEPKNELEELKSLGDALEIARKSDRDVILMDHRGMQTKLVHEVYPDLLPRIRGIIQITSSAKKSNEELQGPLKVPLIPLYNSFWKRNLEGTATAMSIIKTIEQKIQTSFRGSRVAVYGYGSVGRPLSMFLKRRGAHVIVIDIDPLQLRTAQLEGFETLEDVNDLPPSDFIITVTGCNPHSEPGMFAVEADHLTRMAKGRIFAINGGSGQEIDKAGLDLMVDRGSATKTPLIIGQRRVATRYETVNGVIIDLVADGEPVNLSLGDGNPLRIMDIVQATILELVQYVATRPLLVGLHPFPREVDLAIDDLVRKTYGGVSGLLEGS